MKTVELKLYKLDELPEEVQAEAIERFRYSGGLDFNESFSLYALPTFKAFCEVFSIEHTNYSVGAYDSSWATGQVDDPYRDGDTTLESLKGNRLRTWIVNRFDYALRHKRKYWAKFTCDSAGKVIERASRESRILYSRECPLTGSFMDEEILQPLRDFIKEPNDKDTFQDIVDRCLDAWTRAAQKDLEYAQSDEAIRDLIMTNEYYFDEFGNMSRYG